jgi:hypothetical protein
MKLEEHCLECEQKLGQAFPEVHRWLDEFAGSEKYGMRHRSVRHHEEGIQEIVELFGPKAGEAARLHIVSDLKGDGWKDGDHFPVDEKDYVNMGLF